MSVSLIVIPAKAGTQTFLFGWTPACAGERVAHD